MSPAMENSLAMRGTQPKAFPQQNHKSHMDAHGEFVATRMVQINPQLYAMMEGHILEHIALVAALQVEEEMKQQTQQVQQMAQQAQQNPQMGQQVQAAVQELQNQKEARVAELEAEMVAEMAKREKEAMENNQDPLVRLKQQEIDLKAAEMSMKGEVEDNKLMADIGIEAEKLDLERDKLKSGIQQTIVKEGLSAIKESNQETIDEIKENMQTLREDKKLRSTERVAAMNARSRNNGRTNKNNK